MLNAETHELLERFTLQNDELELVAGKSVAGRLGFALLLKHFQYCGCFPDDMSSLPSDIVGHVAEQIEVNANTLARYDLAGRSGKRHRTEIRELTGFRECTAADLADVSSWLSDQAKAYADHEQLFDFLLAKTLQRLRDLKIEPPTPERTKRVVRSAVRAAEQHLLATLAARIPKASKLAIDELLKAKDSGLSLTELKADPGRPSLESIFQEIAKLTCLRGVALPDALFEGISRKLLQRNKQRIAAESLHETVRHPDKIRYTLVASFCHIRCQEITDSLVDLLIQIIHGIGARSKKKVEKEMLTDLRKVSGKSNILCQLAETAVTHPDGVIRDVVFPVVSEKTLKALVKELKASGPFTYRSKVQTVMRASYGSHYRRMVPALLTALEFRSNNDMGAALL